MDAQTIETYNKLSKEYDEETVDFWELFPATVIDTFSKIVTGKVLDVGCGPGRDALLLKNKGLDVIGIDASEEMVRIATARGINSVVGDFASLPFENATFGGVWAYTSLLHVPKSEVHAAIQEIKRVLAPGGIFGLGLIEGEGEMYKESSGMQAPRFFSFYSKVEVEALLIQHDFKILSFEEFKPRSKNYLNFISQNSA